MRIKVDSEEELLKVAQEALHLLVNMRHYQKRWHTEFGAILKNRKKEWEDKADTFLERLQMEKSFKSGSIKIEIDNSNEKTNEPIQS